MKQFTNPEESRIVSAVKKASPAVVSIVASAEVPKLVRCMVPPGYPGLCVEGVVKKPISAGSGFLVTADGYVMTNKHVISSIEKGDFVVILNDGKSRGEKLPAKVIAVDPVSDIAVLKVNKKGLPFAEFADSEDLSVGQTAMAIGYALGQFANTVSKGVVSGLSRSIVAGDFNGLSEQLFGIIQTDAAINFGNSGGPLIDSEGRVIGMSVASAMMGEALGFALPSNELKKVFEMVKQHGRIARPFLGIRSLQLTPGIKDEGGFKSDYGSLVISELGNPVVAGSPAAKAGIVAEDIILKWNDKKIDEDHPIGFHLNLSKVGDTVSVEVMRKGKIKKMKLTLSDWPKPSKKKLALKFRG